MKKSLILFSSLLIILTSIISAYSYGSFSFGEVLDSFGGENLGLLIVFLLFFALITVILNRTRFFEENRAASTIISLMLTLGITYFGFYKTQIISGIDVSGIFSGFGISDSTINIITSLVVLSLVIFLLIKIGSWLFLLITLILGGLGIWLGDFGLVVWGILSLIAFVFALIFSRWRHTTRIRVSRSWNIFGKKKDKIGENLAPSSGNQPPTQSSRPSGVPTLISEAKRFKKWTETQNNPKFYQSWAYFLSWLKKKGYGNNENEICTRINVTHQDILHIVKKYIN